MGIDELVLPEASRFPSHQPAGIRPPAPRVAQPDRTVQQGASPQAQPHALPEVEAKPSRTVIQPSRRILPPPPPLPGRGGKSRQTQPEMAPSVAASLPESLEAIRAEIGDCSRCRLCETRRNIVFGAGNPNADLMFVGEGPGEDEDVQGEPFVGEAGQLLTRIIEKGMGLSRDEVYIANTVKCRPPNNRVPYVDETETCYPFLRRQIAAVKPKVIVALGNSAAHTLLSVSIGIAQLRGNFYRYGDGVRIMPTFHPAYLVRKEKEKNTSEKAKVWADIQKVMQELGLPTR